MRFFFIRSFIFCLFWTRLPRHRVPHGDFRWNCASDLSLFHVRCTTSNTHVNPTIKSDNGCSNALRFNVSLALHRLTLQRRTRSKSCLMLVAEVSYPASEAPSHTAQTALSQTEIRLRKCIHDLLCVCTRSLARRHFMGAYIARAIESMTSTDSHLLLLLPSCLSLCFLSCIVVVYVLTPIFHFVFGVFLDRSRLGTSFGAHTHTDVTQNNREADCTLDGRLNICRTVTCGMIRVLAARHGRI